MLRLRKNITLTIGIIGCSFIISSFLISWPSLYATYADSDFVSDTPRISYTSIERTVPSEPITRNYEIQFHIMKLHNRLNYKRLSAMRITKLIYRVFEDQEKDGGLYFNNTQFHTLQPALEQLIAEFDFKHLNLCAWMIGRNFKWITDISLFDSQIENDTRQEIPKLDIFNPDAIRKIITIYKELASCKIDAILIQDDFILRYNEGFSSWGKTYFSAAAKVPAVEKLMMTNGTPYNEVWKRVKIDQLKKVLKSIVENCKMVNSAIKIGINIYYETPVFPEKAGAWYAHNLKEILETGVDFIYLMSYQRQIKDEMNWNEEKNRAFFKEIIEKAYDLCKEKLVVKLQIRDWKTAERIPLDEVRAYLELIPPQVEHVCFTPVKVEDYDYLEELIGIAVKVQAGHPFGAKDREEKKEIKDGFIM